MSIALNVNTNIRGIEESGVLFNSQNKTMMMYNRKGVDKSSEEHPKRVKVTCLPNATILIGNRVVGLREMAQLNPSNRDKLVSYRRMAVSIGKVCNIDISGRDVCDVFPGGIFAYQI